MRGHEEASGTKYVPKDLLEQWSLRDPLSNFEAYLERKGWLSVSTKETLRRTFSERIEQALEAVFAEPEPTPSLERELTAVYAPAPSPNNESMVWSPDNQRELRLVDAVREGLDQAMERDPALVLMGQDIGSYGGVFKATEGLMERYGSGRVRNTPLCESAIVGAALGLSIAGKRAMVEMQFADFVTCGFNQIVNNLAKLHYRWQEHADVVVRMPTGAGMAAGPFHSQSNEAWFAHTPGLKVVYPAFPYDAKGLLCQAFEDPNPVIFFEHKGLYRSISGQVPTDFYTVPFGKAQLIRTGSQFTIVTYGLGVHWAMDYLNEHPEQEADLIDLRTLLPLDMETIYASVKKTGRVIVLHEDSLTGGIGGEIAARIGEDCFEHLDAPVVRCASLDTPIPFNAELEKNFLANRYLGQSIDKLLRY